MFRAILKALTRRFARAQKPSREILPISLCAEEDGNRTPEDTAISEPTQSVPANEIPSPELNGNGKPEKAIFPDHSRSVPASELPSPELNGNGNSGNAAIPEHAHSVPENEIQMRAYLKWEAAGKPKGQESRFWLEAREELLERADRASS